MTFKISVCLDFKIDQNPNTNGIPLNCDSSLRMSKDEGMQLNAQVKHFSHHESTNLFEVRTTYFFIKVHLVQAY